jgi:hypothetical protein
MIAGKRASVTAPTLAFLSAVSLVWPCIGCRGSRANAGADADAPGAGDASETRSTTAPDAAPPADDLFPSNARDELAGRARHLLDAIAHSDATFATDSIFPRDGWLLMRDAPDPGREWEKRVASPFRRAIHALSRHRTDLADAQTVSVEIGAAMTQATPERHGWKKPLWIVHDSKVVFVVAGRTRTLRIREMVAWRGAWYVTRLR